MSEPSLSPREIEMLKEEAAKVIGNSDGPYNYTFDSWAPRPMRVEAGKLLESANSLILMILLALFVSYQALVGQEEDDPAIFKNFCQQTLPVVADVLNDDSRFVVECRVDANNKLTITETTVRSGEDDKGVFVREFEGNYVYGPLFRLNLKAIGSSHIDYDIQPLGERSHPVAVERENILVILHGPDGRIRNLLRTVSEGRDVYVQVPEADLVKFDISEVYHQRDSQEPEDVQVTSN